MRISVLAVGERMPAWVETGCSEYLKRFPRGFTVDLVEVPAAKRTRATPASKAMADESKRLEAALPAGAALVALDERGTVWSTAELAAKIERFAVEGRSLAFAIGGADGHAPGVRTRAAAVWSLSRLTLPHGLARLLVVEQLYRTWSILNGHPYHRA